MRHDILVGVNLISGLSSTKHKAGKRGSEMHHTNRGNQWYFVINSHAGLDKDSVLILSVVDTATNLCDLPTTDELLHSDEKVVCDGTGNWASSRDLR